MSHYPAQPGFPGGPQFPQAGPASFAPPPQLGSAVIHDTIGQFEGLHFRIDHRDSNSLLAVQLQPGFQIKVRPGAMVAMDATVKIQGKVWGVLCRCSPH